MSVYEKRMDIIITYNKQEYIIEMKIWYGEKHHQKGLKQLEDYLEVKDQQKGYLVIFNFNKTKEHTKRWVKVNGKDIYEVMV